MGEGRGENREEKQSDRLLETSTFDVPLDTPLTAGSVILDGRYRVLEWLHHRPRLNLYLGRRQPRPHMTKEQKEQQEEQETLVVIRELCLTGLTSQEQQLVIAAAFEEFVSPGMFGSQRLPGAGDRVRVENERHYLIMQLRGARGNREGRSEPPTVAIPLAELLLNRRQWPLWLGMDTALNWSIQLCRIVARMHRLGLRLGDVNPNTVLVDEGGLADWSPVLLVSWPPAPHYWPSSLIQSHEAVHPFNCIFPIATNSPSNPFAAPETLWSVCDERSDVYSLGAICYLLLTRYAPVAVARRLQAPQTNQTKIDALQSAQNQGHLSAPTKTDIEGIALIPPRLFNATIPAALEQIMLRALALEPEARYASVFALLEALERVDMPQSDDERSELREQKGSPFERMVRRIRHD